MYQKISKNKILILILTVLAFIPVLSLFHSGLPLTHDGQDHVVRVANFYQSLMEGNLIPRWADNLNWGYGHPVLEFLYPLPSYIASFFHFSGFSLVDSVKVVYGLGMVMSLFFMYLWLSQFTSKYASLFGAVLYTYAPYRFVETYVRGDIGENLAFAFIPLVLFFLYKIYKKPSINVLILGGFSLALLILSHNAISLMFVPIIIGYGLLLLYFSKNRKSYFLHLAFFIFLGFAVSAFFWVPGLIEGKYTLRNIVTRGSYLGRFVSIGQLIYGPWSYGGTGQFTVQFGFFQWISLIAFPFLLIKLKKNKEKLYLATGLFAFTIFAVFLMLPISNFIWTRFLLLQNFQFPWRFLAIIVFTTAVLGTFLAQNISKKFNKAVIACSIFLIIIISSFYWSPKAYLYKPVSFYTGIYNGTTDTGESAPVWSVRFMEQRPKKHLEVIDGHAQIKELGRTSTYHKYQLTVNTKTLFKENTLYFPGWSISADGNPLDVQFQNMTYRGVMLFSLPKGNYTVEAKYSETKLRAIADAVSLVALLNVLSFLGFRFVKKSFS